MMVWRRSGCKRNANDLTSKKRGDSAIQTLQFEKKFTFFAFSLENICVIQKKVVILQAFSRERCLSARVRNKKSRNIY